MTRFRDIQKKMDKDFPKYTMSGDSADFAIDRIPTGIFVFDLLTGGGFPRGRISIVWGKESTGKTEKTLRAIGNYLRMNPNEVALLADFEHTYDQKWAANFIDASDLKNRLFVISPDYGEQGIDMMVQYAQADDIGLIVVDSIAMMIPTVDAENSAEDDTRGTQAKCINKMFRKLIPILSQKKRLTKTDLTLILINQITVNQSKTSRGPELKKPGGVMQNLVASLDIQCYTKSYKKVGKDKTPESVTQTFTIIKNKVGLPKRSGEYTTFLMDKGSYKIGDLDELDVIIEYAKRCNLIERNGNEWKIGNQTFSNLSKLQSFLEEDPKRLQKLKIKTLDKCIAEQYQSEDSEEEATEDEDN